MQDVVIATLVRFLTGGALIALLPLVSQRFGSSVAGVFLLFPAVSVIGLVVLGQAQGNSVVASASLTALIAVPTVAVFLLVVHLTLSRGIVLPLALATAIAAWLLTAVPIVWLRAS